MTRGRTRPATDWIGGAACGAVTVLAVALSLRKLDDFDTWWHLAAGRWISEHGAIPATDTLSHTVRGHPWIDLQWAFDLGAYLLHGLGGPTLLGVTSAFGFSLAIVLVLRLVRPHVGSVLGALLVFFVVLAAHDRFAVRPELLSFPLLIGVLSILQHGRLHEGRRLRLLVPLMIIWVNVHALFVIGAFAIACALLGEATPPSRRLTLWGGASLAATLINPYGLRGVLFPLKLLSRIDRSNPVFQTIAEFRSPFSADAAGVSIDAYKIVLFSGCAAVVAAVVVVSVRARSERGAGRFPRFDWGGLAFFVGLAALSIAARRNAALFAIGCAPYIARCAGTAVRALPENLRAWGRGRAALAGGVVAAAACVLIASVLTGAFYRWDGQAREFGTGVIEGIFPVRAAAFAREAKLPAKLYNDFAAGGYLTWDDPTGQGVFIDGRLEVYDTPFFSDYVEAMYDQARWQSDADRYGVQTAIIFHHWENRRLMVERLVRGGVWSLVYADEVAAVFVRAQGNEAAIARAVALNDKWNQATREWLSRPSARWPYPAGRVEGTRGFAGFLATVGDPEGAVEAYTKLLELGVGTNEERDVRLLLARRFASTGRSELAKEQATRILAIDPRNAEARRLLSR